ncbi:MAG: hypothetical protein KAR42_07540 [candidate division Zixibacteria bacterium]|nr:hypothetical protein [candidate division Zixibacteria bacterium]
MMNDPQIEYPIYIADHGNWMTLIVNLTELNYEIETIDIETDEYLGWDSNGRRVELYLDSRRNIDIKLISYDCYIHELITAILAFAKTAKKKVAFTPSKENLSPYELFMEVDRFINNIWD